jgi:hypothetical protein
MTRVHLSACGRRRVGTSVSNSVSTTSARPSPASPATTATTGPPPGPASKFLWSNLATSYGLPFMNLFPALATTASTPKPFASPPVFRFVAASGSTQ